MIMELSTVQYIQDITTERNSIGGRALSSGGEVLVLAAVEGRVEGKTEA